MVDVIDFQSSKPFKIPQEVKDSSNSIISLQINRNCKAIIQNIKNIEVNQNIANDLIKKVNDIVNYSSKSSSIR